MVTVTVLRAAAAATFQTETRERDERRHAAEKLSQLHSPCLPRIKRPAIIAKSATIFETETASRPV